MIFLNYGTRGALHFVVTLNELLVLGATQLWMSQSAVDVNKISSLTKFIKFLDYNASYVKPMPCACLVHGGVRNVFYTDQ